MRIASYLNFHGGNDYERDETSEEHEGGHLVARLTGYQGGEGVLELAQRKGQNPKLLAIMTGLQEKQDFDIFYAPGIELASCHKATQLKDNLRKKLVTIDSDGRGMAVQPWIDVDFHILSDDVVDKVVLIVEANTSNVIDCGELKIHGNTSDWYRALNGSGSVSGQIVIFLVAVLFLG
uniref:Peptidase A1 domain-containing protein n=1 Tax=Angiostrongylus cantonensis TaxID=6313 RepID=A0A0K0CWR5_ANGCA